MRQNKKAEAGYVLVWAAVTMIIAAIMIAGTLMVSRAYAARNLNNAVADQAYLTARSAAEAIASLIDGSTAVCAAGESPDYGNPLIPADGGSIEINGGSFDFPAAMGTVDAASIIRRGDQIIVSATATKGVKAATVGISILHTMELTEEPDGESATALISGFCGLTAETKLSFASGKKPAIHIRNCDIYAPTLSYAGQPIQDIIVDGVFYTQNPQDWNSRLPGVELKDYPLQAGYAGYPLPVITNNTKFPVTAPIINGSGVTVDLTEGEDIYYKLGVTNDQTVVKVDDDHDYYILVPSGKTFDLNVEAATGTAPRIFIIVNGALRIRDPGDAYIYVYTAQSTVIMLSDGVKMRGAIHARNISLLGSLDFTYVPTSESGPMGDGAKEMHRWDNDKYILN
ncbi:MAG: hypothetical protein GX572_02010 [Clostridia bacterium]|nr:hypothetical protein [Clostridia bacterium]